MKKFQYRSLPKKLVDFLMCKRLFYDMSWPGYVWLVINYDNELVGSCYDKVILFWYYLDLDTGTSNSKVGILNKETRMASGCGPIILTHCNISAKARLARMYFLQQNRSKQFISNYSTSAGLSSVSLPYIPPDIHLNELDVLSIISSVTYLLVIVFISVTLTLYLYFRKEPTIRATAVPLNLLSFLGCYLLLGYNLLLSSMHWRSSHKDVVNLVCNISVWLYGWSVPMTLILCVLLMKLVRVYRLFHYFDVTRKWPWYDGTLALYALLLPLPSVIICATLSAMSKWKLVINAGVEDNEFVARYKCQSVGTVRPIFQGNSWHISVSICLVLLLVVLKSRQIIFQQFRYIMTVICLLVLLLNKLILAIVYNSVFRISEYTLVYSFGFFLQTKSISLYFYQTEE